MTGRDVTPRFKAPKEEKPLKKGLLRRTPLRSKGLKRKQTERLDADQEWALAVKKRDGHRCKACGWHDKTIQSEWIHAHHIASRKRRPDLRHDVDNGITLCHVCHRWAHEHPERAAELGLLSTEKYEGR